MRKNFFLVLLTLVLTLACIGPIPAFASEPIDQPDTQSVVLSTEYVYYYQLIDGKKYYRIWNASYGRWETPWLPC